MRKILEKNIIRNKKVNSTFDYSWFLRNFIAFFTSFPEALEFVNVILVNPKFRSAMAKHSFLGNTFTLSQYYLFNGILISLMMIFMS